MNRYIARSTGTGAVIVDTTTGQQVGVCGNLREATTFTNLLNTHRTRRRSTVLSALATKAVALLPANKGSHPDILAARAAQAN